MSPPQREESLSSGRAESQSGASQDANVCHITKGFNADCPSNASEDDWSGDQATPQAWHHGASGTSGAHEATSLLGGESERAEKGRKVRATLARALRTTYLPLCVCGHILKTLKVTWEGPEKVGTASALDTGLKLAETLAVGGTAECGCANFPHLLRTVTFRSPFRDFVIDLSN
jgi:hypothetical protein